jgi:hypothetical protein
MMKNKGFLPSGPSEIAIQRKQIKEIIFSLLPACKDADPNTGIPFKVDAIVANPPAYGQSLYALCFFFFVLKLNSSIGQILRKENIFFLKINQHTGFSLFDMRLIWL